MGEESVAKGRRGQKGCGQDEWSQQVCGAWKVTIEIFRGRALYSPVLARGEVP